MSMKTSLHGMLILGISLICGPVWADAPRQADSEPPVDVRNLLEKGQAKAALPEGLVVRISACMGEAAADAPPETKDLVEMWEFTPGEVHRVKSQYKEGKPVYERLESHAFETKDLCKDLLDGRAIEIQTRKGTGPETVLAGTIYERGSRSIAIELNGRTILNLRETNGPALDVYRATDAQAFGKLYDRLATQARKTIVSKPAE